MRRELLRIRIAAKHAESLHWRTRRMHYRANRRIRGPLCEWVPGKQRDTTTDIAQVTCKQCLRRLEKLANGGGLCG